MLLRCCSLSSLLLLLLFIFLDLSQAKSRQYDNTHKSNNVLNHHLLHKLTRIYGLHGIGVVFGEQILSQAISKELHRQHQRQWHLSAHQDDQEYYLACTDYNHSTDTKTALAALDIGWIITYSSLHDALMCGYIHIHGQALQLIEGNALLQFSILTPVPNLAKFDVSIPYLQRYFAGFEMEEEGSTVTMDHPIIAHLTAGKSTGLAVQFNKVLSKEERDVLLATWQEILSSASVDSYLTVMRDVYPQEDFTASQEQSQNHVAKVFSKVSHPAAKLWTAASASTKLHRGIWDSMLVQLQAWHRQGKSLVDVCHFEDFAYVPNKRGMYIRFPAALQAEVEQQGKSARHFGLCLTFVSNVIAMSKDVAKVAVSVPMQLQNNNARTIVQSGSKSNTEPYFDAGLTGAGNIIGVSDTGIDENHCMFKDSVHGKVKRSSELDPFTDLKYRKVVQYVNYSGSGGDYADGHGSHVAGTLAGNCELASNDKNAFRGMAPMAKLAFFDIGVNDAKHDLVLPEDMIRDLYGPAYRGGARIHSNSWGGGYYFDTFCLETDEFLYTHDDMLVVFAAGNNGNNGMRTVLSPALAKNSLAVGCTHNEHTTGQNLDYIAVFSSHGPTFDGRLKPEIVAPGFYLMSAKATQENRNTETCEMEYKAGTSMATPVVAGNAALIREYFQHPGHWARTCNPSYGYCAKGSFSPSGVLVKALIMHSGKPVKAYDGRGSSAGFVVLTSAPDVYQGYGRMDLSAILPLQPYSHAPFQLYVDEDSVGQLTQRKYAVQVNSSHHPLRITLTWYDPPNDIFAAKFLLHDLDLILVSPSGVTFYGNSILDQDTPGFGARRDDLNNYEQLTIEMPHAGEWTVMVQCKALTESTSQKYSIVVTGNAVVEKREDVSSLTMALMQDCVSYGVGRSRYQLGVSKWARSVNQGWGGGDAYVVNSTSSTLTTTGTFHEKFAYAVDELCLPAGCYELSLRFGTTPTPTLGIQAEFPQCEVYLSPLASKQHVCIDAPKLYNDTIPSNTMVELFDDHACRDRCWTDEHYAVKVLLHDEGGSGWSGSYFSIMPDPLTADASKLTLADTGYTAVSGNLEFTEFESQDKCLRKSSTQCYHVHLSFPKGTTDDPEVYFPDAHVVEVIPGTGTYRMVNQTCPHFLNMTRAYAKFCVGDAESVTGLPSEYHLLHFYEPVHSLENLGQSALSLSSFWNTVYSTPAHIKATCALHVSQVAFTNAPTAAPSPVPTLLPSNFPTLLPSNFATSLPSNVPTSLPSNLPTSSQSNLPTSPPSNLPTSSQSNFPAASPTIQPSIPVASSDPSAQPSSKPSTNTSDVSPMDDSSEVTATPTVRPTRLSSPLSFDQMNYSCFADCLNYPGENAFTLALNGTCIFLLDIYMLCDSFSIAYGYCPRPACAADCSIDTWCYFAAGTVASCPAFEDYLPWTMNNSLEAIELHQQCSYTLLSTEASSESDNNASLRLFWTSTTVGYFVGIVIVIAVLAVAILAQRHRHKQDLNGEGGSAAYGNLPDNSQSAADIELQEHVESSDDGFNQSDVEDNQPTSMKDKLIAKGKDMLDKGKEQLKKQGLLSKASKHAKDTKKRGEYEMLPLDSKQAVFTIHGDDDDEEEEEQFNPVQHGSPVLFSTFETKPQS